MFKHIHDLNFKLKGRRKSVCDLLSEIKSFSKKIDFLCEDVENERLHFPNFKSVFDYHESIDINQFINLIEKP